MVVVTDEEHGARVDPVGEQHVRGDGAAERVVLEDVAQQQPVGELVGGQRPVDLDVEHLGVVERIAQIAGVDVDLGLQPAERPHGHEQPAAPAPAEEWVFGELDLIPIAEEPAERDCLNRADVSAERVAGLVEIDAAEPLHVPVHARVEPNVSGKREVHADPPHLVYQEVGEIVVPRVGHLRTPVDEPALGPPAIAEAAGDRLDVAPPHEPDVGVELRVDRVAGDEVIQVAPLAPHADVEHVPGRIQKRAPGRVLQVEVAVLGRDGAEPDGRRVAEPEVPVGTDQPAVAVEELAVGDDGAEVRLGVEVVADPSDQHVGGLLERRVRDVIEIAGRLVVGDQHPDGGLAHLAGHLAAVSGVDDGPRVHEVHRPRQAENLLSLEEERAQLGEEQREPLVHFNLRPVRLDLREVGVEGEVERQVRRQPVLEIDTALGLRLLGKPTGRRVEIADLHRRHGRQNLEIPAGRQTAHPVEQPHLGQEAGDIARERRPDDCLVLVAYLPRDLKSPPVGLIAHRRIAQAFERNRHFGGPAVVDQCAARVEQGVPRRVAPWHAGPATTKSTTAAAAASAAATTATATTATAARVHQRITLHAVPVEREDVCALLVEKRVEVDRDGVVAEICPVAIDPVGAHHSRIGVVGVHAEVDVAVVVGDEDLGVFGRRGAFDRALLDELGDASRTLPDRVVELSVNAWRVVRPGGGHARATGEDAGKGRRPYGRRRTCVWRTSRPATSSRPARATGPNTFRPRASRRGSRRAVGQDDAAGHRARTAIDGGAYRRGAVVGDHRRPFLSGGVERRKSPGPGRTRGCLHRRARTNAGAQLAGNLVLQVENLVDGAVYLRRTRNQACHDVDQPGGNPYLPPQPLVTTRDHPSCAELAAKRRHAGIVDRAAIAVACGGANPFSRNDSPCARRLDVGNQCLRDAVTEPVVTRVAGDVRERDNGNRRSVFDSSRPSRPAAGGRRSLGRRRAGPCGITHMPGGHRESRVCQRQHRRKNTLPIDPHRTSCTHV